MGQRWEKPGCSAVFPPVAAIYDRSRSLQQEGLKAGTLHFLVSLLPGAQDPPQGPTKQVSTCHIYMLMQIDVPHSGLRGWGKEPHTYFFPRSKHLEAGGRRVGVCERGKQFCTLFQPPVGQGLRCALPHGDVFLKRSSDGFVWPCLNVK